MGCLPVEQVLDVDTGLVPRCCILTDPDIEPPLPFVGGGGALLGKRGAIIGFGDILFIGGIFEAGL